MPDTPANCHRAIEYAFTMSSDRRRSEVLICSNGVSIPLRAPRTDIDRCIIVTPWRRIFTIFTIILAITDIPRTGLTFRIRDFYKARVAPHSVTYWGPFEYHVAHLHAESGDLGRINASVNASRSGKPINALEVWAYKHDSLSIAQRAVAQQLNVASYPDCILYRSDCTTSILNVTTVFTMLDDLVGAVSTQWFPKGAPESRPFVFFAKSNWVDRLNHILVQPLTKNPEHRLHAIYHIPTPRGGYGLDPRRICDERRVQRTPVATTSLPVLCDHPTRWNCDNPIKPTGKRSIPIWDHIGLRFDQLQRQHPELDLDFTMLASTFVDQTHNDHHVLPTVTFTIDTLEVTTFIRGRKCNQGEVNCRTVFIDDFRYERSSVESDEEQWTYYVWALRGGSQLYVWVRVVLLFWGCFRARRAEEKYRDRSFLGTAAAACLTVLKIPGHTIVYGSWIPIVGYAAAHFFDASIVHFVIEFQWSSLSGLFDFNPIKYIIDASVQMRNIWMIALIWKCSLLLASISTSGRSIRLHQHFDGILAVRGGWIGVVSWLATFGFVRALSFRDTNVVSITELPRGTPLGIARTMQSGRNYADKGVRFDLKCTFMACVIIAIAGTLVKIIVRVLTGRETSVFTSRSSYVPFSAGSLWSWSTLHTVWGFKLRAPSSGGIRTWSVGPTLRELSSHQRKSRPSLCAQGKSTESCELCTFRASAIHWRPAQGCVHHEPIFNIHHRTTAIWSMVQLTNIANMTDPLVLASLYLLGRRLFVYNITPHAQPPYFILLPIGLTEIHHSSHVDGLTHAQGARTPYRIELAGTVNSRDVPWQILVQCG